MKAAKKYLFPGLGVLLLAIVPGLLTFMVYVQMAHANTYTNRCGYTFQATAPSDCTDGLNPWGYGWTKVCLTCGGVVTGCPDNQDIAYGWKWDDKKKQYVAVCVANLAWDGNGCGSCSNN